MKRILIRGELVIDGTGAHPIDKGAIFIEGQRIIRVGKEEDLREKVDVHVLDCSDQTLPPDLIDGHLRQREEVAQRMKAAIKAGVKFAVGTDGMHGGLAQEIQYLVDFGATTNQALMAATRHAARVCGLEESVGTLEPGKFGDIIGVKGNPLEDIRALKRVKTVVSRGEIKHQANQ